MSKFTIVKTETTRITAADLMPTVSKCYAEITGDAPDAASLCLIVAQSALETGAWKSIQNFNVGNIRPGRGWRGQVCQFKCNERIMRDGKWVVEWYSPTDPRTNFRAFPTLEEGVRDYCRFLGVDTTPHNGKPNRYQDCWDAIVEADGDDADVYEFVTELYRAGYFTAPPDLYYDGRNGKGGVLALYRQFMPVVEAFVEVGADKTLAPPAPGDIETGTLEEMNRRLKELEAEMSGMKNWRAGLAEATAA